MLHLSRYFCPSPKCSDNCGLTVQQLCTNYTILVKFCEVLNGFCFKGSKVYLILLGFNIILMSDRCYYLGVPDMENF